MAYHVVGLKLEFLANHLLLKLMFINAGKAVCVYMYIKKFILHLNIVGEIGKEISSVKYRRQKNVKKG